MSGKNPFGGGNKNSLYTPMSDVEQEVVARLRDTGDLRVHIKGWGVVAEPRVIVGDLRVALHFRMTFDEPHATEAPQPLHYIDLELRTGTGLLLAKERQATLYNYKPVQVAAGMFLDMVWDLAIQAMDPAIVKTIKPSATGLTSRWQDRDTGEMTMFGNTKMTSGLRNTLVNMREGEAKARTHTAKQAAKATAYAEGTEKLAASPTWKKYQESLKKQKPKK